jgi:miniconductance mechanosensitive channel
MLERLPPALQHAWVESALFLIAVALCGLFANFFVKRLLLRAANRLLQNTSFGKDAELRRHGVIPRLANIVPALVISGGLAVAPDLPDQVSTVGQNLAQSFIILTIALAVGGTISIFDTIYHRRPEGRLRPIKSYLQIGKLGIAAVAVILIIATLFDKSPLILLSGLGAMTAVLLLVFQDTLLSLVAGIQISSSVRVGDWITIPSLNADGDVIEVALHTVKVRNFDKTITTIPIRKLVTDSYQNWRGMQESGGRRIKRSLHIDQTSVRFLSDQEIVELGSIDILRPYLDEKKRELAASNTDPALMSRHLANGRRLTNIGTFRAYVEAYLGTHPGIKQEMTLLVRQLDLGRSGIPIEVYAFTNTVDWAAYEGIQSDIFDHLLAVLPAFDLGVFQDVSGRDLAGLRKGDTAPAAG